MRNASARATISVIVSVCDADATPNIRPTAKNEGSSTSGGSTRNSGNSTKAPEMHAATNFSETGGNRRGRTVRGKTYETHQGMKSRLPKTAGAGRKNNMEVVA